MDSVVVNYGETILLCSATIQEGIPNFLRGTGSGWLTAEYAMLPASTSPRTNRERRGIAGRSQEIQRLIGRSLRSVLDMFSFPERTLIIDCDVLRADGGTRTAAITGGYVALARLLRRIGAPEGAVKDSIAAVSVGLVDGRVLLDLNYEEDRSAEVDANIVRKGDGGFVEIQLTGETASFDRKLLDRMLDVTEDGLKKIRRIQLQAIKQQ